MKLRKLIRSKAGIYFLVLAVVAIGYIFYESNAAFDDPKDKTNLRTATPPRFTLIGKNKVEVGDVKNIRWSRNSSFFVQTGVTGLHTVWSTQGHLISKIRVHAGGGTAISPDGKFMFLSSGYKTGFGTLSKVDLSKKEIVEIIDAPKKSGWARQMAFSPDGERLIVLYRDGAIRIFDTMTWKLLRGLKSDSPFGVQNLAVSPDNKYFAIGTSAGEVLIWDYRTGENINRFQAQTGSIDSLTYSRDGKVLLTGGSATRSRYDSATGKWVHIMDSDLVRVWAVDGWAKTLGISEGMEGKRSIHSLEISPNGRWIVVGTERDFLRIYDAQNGKIGLQLPVDFVVKSVRFSPDGKYLAAATDFSVFLWSVAFSPA